MLVRSVWNEYAIKETRALSEVSREEVGNYRMNQRLEAAIDAAVPCSELTCERSCTAFGSRRSLRLVLTFPPLREEREQDQPQG